jgi:glucan phosphoethanolaminetransferase (alkaline phosphatase superfamily)
MIKLSLILLFVSFFLYFILFKLSQWQRIIIAFLAFLISAIIILCIMSHYGDKPTSGAKDVTKEMIDKDNQ